MAGRNQKSGVATKTETKGQKRRPKLDFGWGELTEAKFTNKLVGELRNLCHSAYYGHKPSQRLISKIVSQLPPRSILNHYYLKIPPSVYRTMQVRLRMYYLDSCVRPANPKAKSALHGPVVLDPSAKGYFYYPTAEEFYKPRSTLKSLAVRIYIEELRQSGITTIDERVIARDMSFCRKWEAEHHDLLPQTYLMIRGTDELLQFVFD